MKIPEPMIPPITIIVASKAVRRRASWVIFGLSGDRVVRLSRSFTGQPDNRTT